MNLVNEVVIHKVFGKGRVSSLEDNYMVVSFHGDEKKFLYPDSFDEFFEAQNPKLNDEIQAQLAVIKEKEIKEYEEKKQRDEEQRELSTPRGRRRSAKARKIQRANVAFKCNYCDGGKTSSDVGFNGVCSDDTMVHNIEVKKRAWCSSAQCPCFKYLKGELKREQLEKMNSEGNFVCYESQMFKNWKAFAGVVQSGKRKNEPMRLQKVQKNSLCVLTTRDIESTEKDRYIFGVFLVDESYEGDKNTEGYVGTNSKYKLKLSLPEARKMLFWNYHFNDNRPEVAMWSSGLHRYLDDNEAVQILSDIVKLKKGTSEEKLSIEFLDYYCEVNNIQLGDVPEKNGAIMRTKNLD
ncbi:hypothetical protein SAMN02745248_00166 [Hathewaya proteolytica DSM 3090]|uniref:Uncharacterized protein n=1 Tax=Hathewaya proteolytica DSM 3090 TaxID=1121331 RepID=A0A1M6JEV2_9CLOT|nr:hypothetical protein [Hathewaya proteolytica]SHJ45233.1 hypothetical protein SAMN02745248_00166 [Hathewaya proteolytica DSM 3090]